MQKKDIKACDFFAKHLKLDAKLLSCVSFLMRKLSQGHLATTPNPIAIQLGTSERVGLYKHHFLPLISIIWDFGSEERMRGHQPSWNKVILRHFANPTERDSIAYGLKI
ncbi:hypothetical protein JTE90_003464 [Oedothorax gibbosus]|uniref:Uncharacterized protein n=1 Tax=Oedothorax gibbosus TaxID=931172 RepID=A0AAV6U454_9ARAC|nr:hypothetical protein JTE90_003464 [Oedothorax gibbosus]